MSRTTATSAEESGRLYVLDVLRGIALLGMFLVHFAMFSSGGTAADRGYEKVVELLFEERFWSIFGILFGVGFAIQLRRADVRGTPFVVNFLRRLATLAAFGFAAHAFFGFNVLLGYAVWGLPLLLVRRWSIRALVVALIVSAASWQVVGITRAWFGAREIGEQAYRAQRQANFARNRAFREANEKAQSAPSYPAVFRARLQHMRWFYAQPFSYLPVNNFTLFLLGLLGLRLGLFDEPERHRRLIASLAIFGAVSWAVSTWLFPVLPEVSGPTFLGGMILSSLEYGFGLVRTMWLAFTYIGIVLLLVASDPRWLYRLSAFAWTGRMALTNYMIQIAILDVTFSKWALGITVRPLVGACLALALFMADAQVSRWWLARFRFGPLEWLWRSATYAQWQPFRVRPTNPPVAMVFRSSS